MKKIDQDTLKELLSYDESNGCFKWKYRNRKWFKTQRAFNTFNSRDSGNIAGCLRQSKDRPYWVIYILGVRYYAHRLAWLYVHGEWPNQIDHIDHDRLNNKISNLRNVSLPCNSKNLSIRSNNTSGVTGVYWCKKKLKWYSAINNKGKKVHLGYFNTKDSAQRSREKAEVFYGYHENHGI